MDQMLDSTGLGTKQERHPAGRPEQKNKGVQFDLAKCAKNPGRFQVGTAVNIDF